MQPIFSPVFGGPDPAPGDAGSPLLSLPRRRFHRRAPPPPDAALEAALPLLPRLFAGSIAEALAQEPRLRQRLYALAVTRSGITVAQAARELACGYTGARYHADTLLRRGLLREYREGRLRRLVPAHGPRSVVPQGPHAAAASRKVLAVLSERPGATQAEIARELGISASTICRAVARLARAGAVIREGRSLWPPVADAKVAAAT